MVGETILHYELIEKLGEGGAGTVYRAQDTRLGRIVALKFLSQRYAKDSQAKARFMREAQAAARMDHPNIGITHSIEDDGDRLFIVMAHYAGKTLETRLEEGELAFHDIMSYTLQTAKGLAKAHEEGIVHRDIKPANLMITKDGLVKILDFGIAKFDGISGLTQAGGFLGTLAYMSPEQMRGQAIDYRVDIWALGVVLYEMLTGATPFMAADNFSALLLNILSKNPEVVSSLRSGLPKDLDRVIDKALAKEPDERYSSAEAFAQDLLALQHGSTPTATFERPAPRLVTKERANNDDQPDHNIVKQSAPLIGRQDELAVINLHLDHPQCRVLTLFGQGGIGKTRLALEAASEQVELGIFEGIYYVALDDAKDAADIVTGIADALELQADYSLEDIMSHIAEGRLLLILDNFEHLMEEAILPTELVHGCDNLKIMIVSRERLNIAEEWVVPLLGLPLPARGSTIEQALASGAVQLFVQRARRAQLSFALNKDELPAVIRICHLLQGSPLALELAAVWVKMMSCSDIATEIEQDLDFLATSARNVTKRHRSIRTVFEYSWRLLTDTETKVLSKLAAFKRGFRKEAAQEIAAATLPILISLVDKSLLQVTEDWRYEWHPLLYQYAEEKLREDPDSEAQTRSKHSHYYMGLLLDKAPTSKADLLVLEAERDNIVAAWQWALSVQDSASIAKTAPLLALFLTRTSHLRQAINVFETAQQSLTDATTCGPLQLARAQILERSGKLDQAKQIAEAALRLFKEQPDTSSPSEAWRHNLEAAQIDVVLVLSRCMVRMGQSDDARALLEQVHDLASQLVSHKLAAVLAELGHVLLMTGDVTEAEAHFQRALELLQDSGDDYRAAAVLADLGVLHLRYAAPQQARATLEVAYSLAQRIHDCPMLIELKARLARVALALDEFEVAKSTAQDALERLADTPLAGLRSDLQATLAQVHLGEGDNGKAQQHINTALSLAWESGATAQVLEHFVLIAEIHRKRSRLEQAATLLYTVLNHKHAHYLDKRRAWRVLESLTDYVDATILQDAETEGQQANLEALVEYSLQAH
ncbi:MAG: protein kinase [Deinococcota bacterium]